MCNSNLAVGAWSNLLLSSFWRLDAETESCAILVLGVWLNHQLCLDSYLALVLHFSIFLWHLIVITKGVIVNVGLHEGLFLYSVCRGRDLLRNRRLIVFRHHSCCEGNALGYFTSLCAL